MIDWHTADCRRLAYCKKAQPDMTNAELARYYNFRLEFVNEQLGVDNTTPVKRGKRPDWLALAQRHAVTNAGLELTPDDLRVIINCSMPTAYKVIDQLPNHFRKVSRGIWQCRDPKQDKANGL